MICCKMLLLNKLKVNVICKEMQWRMQRAESTQKPRRKDDDDHVAKPMMSFFS